MLGGDNKLVFQYGRGAGTGFGTLARYYYPDFSLYNAPSELRIRVVDVLTIQPATAGLAPSWAWCTSMTTSATRGR